MPSAAKRDKAPMSTPIPRYLVPFHPKHVPHFFTDVLIIGSGLAGLRAALAVDPRAVGRGDHQAGLQRIEQQLCARRHRRRMDPEDRFEDHVADTLEAGGSLCDRGVVERVVGEAPLRIARADRLGHAVRPGRRPAGPGPRGRARPRPHRPRPGRRHRQGDHARDDRAAWNRRPTSTFGKTPSPSTC